MICILVRDEVFLEHVFDITMGKSLSDMTARSVVFALYRELNGTRTREDFLLGLVADSKIASMFCFWLRSEKFRSTYIFPFPFLMSWMVCFFR